MNQLSKELVTNAGFVEDAEYGYKCSSDNIDRLIYYITNQMAAAAYKTTKSKELYTEQVRYATAALGIEKIDWESEPRHN